LIKATKEHKGLVFFWLGVGCLLVANTLLLLNKKLSLQPNQSVGSGGVFGVWLFKSLTLHPSTVVGHTTQKQIT
jgi:hypothetical protein